MEMKEFSGKTVEKAVQAACEHFGVKEDDLEIEIITKGSTGLFGLGSRPAKIKAAPKEGAAPKPAEQAEAPTEGPAEGSPDKTPAEGAAEEAEARQETEEAEAGGPGREQAAEGAKEGRAVAQEEQGAELQMEVRPARVREPAPSAEELKAHVETAVAITNEILQKSGLDGTAELGELDGRPVVNLVGKDLSLLIGKEGQTLDALEYIVNLALKRRSELNQRIVIEASGYRKRRQDSLADLARRMAYKAKKTGKAVVLQPMPAKERRIIHMTLKEVKGVRTHSSGDGHRRKVVITPLRHGRNNRGRSRYNSQRNRRPRS